VIADSGLANLTTASAFADELVCRGLRHTVICPGSRSTPMAVALASHPDIRSWVLIDERSAAFFALGMARQLESPVAILCTSGTAAANLLPAVAEAFLSRIPLIVLTADRPPELRGWGAPQTIDQVALYGSHVKWFVDMPVPDASPALLGHARAAAARAVETAGTTPAGPVHLNLPYREPLLPPSPGAVLPAEHSHQNRSKAVPNPDSRARLPHPGEVEMLVSAAKKSPRGLLVCGPYERSDLADAAVKFSAATGFPILADPLSGVRFGPHRHLSVLDTYDGFLRHPATAAALAPDVVFRVGAIPTSKPLQQFLAAASGCTHLVIDPGAPRDPAHLATTHLQSDPAELLRCVSNAIQCEHFPASPSWTGLWHSAERVTHAKIDSTLRRIEEPFEGRAILETVSALPEGTTLVIGNSMPIRDVDAFARGDERNLRLVGNRGANGIDGVISSALGAAAVSSERIVLLIGDLSFFHDLSGLLAAGRFGLSATIVVLNNDGGGIFSFLPQASQLDPQLFESLFGTPIGLDISAVADLYRASYVKPASWCEFQQALTRSFTTNGLTIIEHVTDRQRNVALHREISGAVVEALADMRPGED
jgi:2-succinyl-5-enolpyruvyl-6-hydroxy-3-cyclohexene-1-carboxylate synthase